MYLRETSVIWKFAIAKEEYPVIVMPSGANLLHVGVQNGGWFVWAAVDPEAACVARSFQVVGTGERFEWQDGVQREYLNSVQEGSYIFHVFALYRNGAAV